MAENATPSSPGMEPVRDAIRLAVVDAFQDRTVQTIMRSVAYTEAKRAMRDGMLTVGVDLAKPSETMDDLKQLREWNLLRKTIRSQFTKSLVAILLAGFLSVLMLGFKEQILQLIGMRPHP